MRKDEKKVSFFGRYLQAIMTSLISAFSIGFLVPLWIATYKLNDIKSGEYPGMPQDQIDKQYDEALPSVIQDSILMCLVITIVALIQLISKKNVLVLIHYLNIYVFRVQVAV